MTAAEIPPKSTFTIDKIQDSPLSVNFLEIGLVPGKSIQFLQQAPFHGPIAFQVDDNILAIREQEAQLILVK
jgi:ferrous iron transport protein A